MANLDPERVVRDSCEVALDMLAYENSADIQYFICFGIP